MKKRILAMLTILLLMITTSCASNISQNKFVKLCKEAEENINSYEELPKKIPDITYFFEIYKNKSYDPILAYQFSISDFLYNKENRYHVSTYYEKEETSFYEYYADTSTYIKRTFTNNEYYDSEEIPMDYDTFYRTYVKLKYHSTLPDFNELKEYSFTNHHTLTPSAEAKITFNSEYYYEFIDDDIVISIKNITGKVTFSAPNGWKVYDITINGVDDSNCRYKLLWRYS